MASKAFNAYKEVADKVRTETPHTINKEPIITISSLKPSASKDSKGDQVFYLNSKSNEAIQFTISAGGNLKSARYIDKDAEPGSKAVFLAKDVDKMLALVKDPALGRFAQSIDWSKVVAKDDVAKAEEAEAPEVEEEQEAEM